MNLLVSFFISVVADVVTHYIFQWSENRNKDN
jgi:hypothetical protein